MDFEIRRKDAQAIFPPDSIISVQSAVMSRFVFQTKEKSEKLSWIRVLEFLIIFGFVEVPIPRADQSGFVATIPLIAGLLTEGTTDALAQVIGSCIDTELVVFIMIYINW